MSKLISYKGYQGTVEYSADDQTLWGKIIAINDLVTYEGTSVLAIKKAFKEAVEDYLELCKEHGKSPDKSFKGVFNVRVSTETHRAIAVAAQSKGVSLNEAVASALRMYVNELPKSVVSEPAVQMASKAKRVKKPASKKRVVKKVSGRPRKKRSVGAKKKKK